MRALVLDDEKPSRLSLHARCDEHRPGFGRGLHPRGDIRRFAEYLARCVDHDLPGIKADARGKPGRARSSIPSVEVGERALDRERRAHRALGVILLGLRIPKQGHQPIAELLQHMAAKPGHRRRSLVEIGVDEVAPVLGVELGGEARRADEIAEHDRDRTTLGRCLKILGWSRLHRGSGTSAGRPPPAIRAIASSSRLRSPTTETPMSLRSSTVSRGSTSASILLSRNFSSYWPSPRPRSHPPTSIAAPHMAWQDNRSRAAACPAAPIGSALKAVQAPIRPTVKG